MAVIGVDLLELEQEHQALQCEIEDWRQWWRELREIGEPRFGEMGGRLRQFRDHLQNHFLHEQQASPLAELESSKQPLGKCVLQLWAEHRSLVEELDVIISRLDACGSNSVCWGDARAVFESFLDRLQAHDAGEYQLLKDLGYDS